MMTKQREDQDIDETPPPPLVFKILRESEWAELERTGVFLGSSDDHRDGFIHLSCEDQVAGTLDRHFRNEAGLVLLTVLSDGLPIRMEASRNDQWFPHLYGPLPRTAVAEVTHLQSPGS